MEMIKTISQKKKIFIKLNLMMIIIIIRLENFGHTAHTHTHKRSKKTLFLTFEIYNLFQMILKFSLPNFFLSFFSLSLFFRSFKRTNMSLYWTLITDLIIIMMIYYATTTNTDRNHHETIS